MKYEYRVKKFINHIDLSNLNLHKEYTGFDCYLPIQFFEDVINFIAHKVNNNLKNDIWIIKDNISEFLLSIPEFIWLSIKKETNIINAALYILKYCSNLIDFKCIENNEFKTIESNKNNYLYNLEYNINLPDQFTNEDISENIHILNVLNSLISFKDEEIINKEKTFGYKKLVKMNNSNFIRPDFSYLMTKKTSFIKKNEIINNKEIIIFVEDNSKSMLEPRNKRIADLVKYFLSEINKEIHYYIFDYNVNSKFLELKNKEEKLNKFSNVIFKNEIYDYNFVLKNIKKTYKNQKIIILSDGENHLNPNQKLNNQLFFINTKIKNEKIETICKINNGKQICL